MSKAVVKTNSLALALERVLIHGDLSAMNEEQRMDYVRRLCKATKLNILLRPFDYIHLKRQNKTICYANKAASEQLRDMRKISLKITSRERIDGLYVVTVAGKDKWGREDEAIGAVNIKGLFGEDLANALMKAETKAKRRLTLSISGLGMLDEVEARELAEKEAQDETEVAITQTTEKIAQTASRPEFETERKTEQPPPSVEPAPPTDPNLANDYTIRTIRGLKGKKITHCALKTLARWLEAYDKLAASGTALSPEVQDEAIHVRDFLGQGETVEAETAENAEPS